MYIQQRRAIGVLLMILFFSCGNFKSRIEGTWTLIHAIKNGKNVKRVDPESKFQIEFLNGEVKTFMDNKRTGIGRCYYKLKGDSLFLTILQIDSLGRNDTLKNIRAFVTIENNEMTVVNDSTIVYYIKEL